MKHDLDTALDQCLDSLRQSRDLEACLASYPQYADELRPLLDLAIDVGWVSAPAPTAAARAAGEERMLATLARVTERRAQLHPLVWAVNRLVGFFTRPGFGFGLVWKWAAAMMAVLLVAACGLAFTASASSLPGDALYPVKLAGQRAQLALTFDPDSQRLLADRFDAQQRSDVEAVLSTGRQVTVDFRGILERMEDAIWIVGGLPVAVDEATTVVGQPHVGASLRVWGELPGDGVLLAVRVEVESDATSLPTPSPQPTGTVWPSLTPTATGTLQPRGTVQSTEGVVKDGATESGELHETPLPGFTVSPEPEDDGAADEAPETPAVPEPGHTPEVQETPDSIDGPPPDESPEPQDTPSIEDPEPDETPEAEDTPESIEDPDSDKEPEPEDTPESVEDPERDEQPEPEDTPESTADPDSDEQPEPEDTPESVEDPDSDEQPESDNTPDVPDMSEAEGSRESDVASPTGWFATSRRDTGILVRLLAMTIATFEREVTFDDSRI